MQIRRLVFRFPPNRLVEIKWLIPPDMMKRWRNYENPPFSIPFSAK